MAVGSDSCTTGERDRRCCGESLPHPRLPSSLPALLRHSVQQRMGPDHLRAGAEEIGMRAGRRDGSSEDARASREQPARPGLRSVGPTTALRGTAPARAVGATRPRRYHGLGSRQCAARRRFLHRRGALRRGRTEPAGPTASDRADARCRRVTTWRARLVAGNLVHLDVPPTAPALPARSVMVARQSTTAARRRQSRWRGRTKARRSAALAISA